jgi:hypothetical protein
MSEHPKLIAQRAVLEQVQSRLSKKVSALLEASDPLEALGRIKEAKELTGAVLAALKSVLALKARYEHHLTIEEITEKTGYHRAVLYSMMNGGPKPARTIAKGNSAP